MTLLVSLALPTLLLSGWEPLRAQPSDGAARNEGITCRMGGSAGARRYRPGAWGLVDVYAINWTSETAEAESVLRFSDDPTLQFGRRVTVPPRSALRTTCPIRVPDVFEVSRFYIDLVTEQVYPPLADSNNRATAESARLNTQSMILDHSRPTVGMIADLRSKWSPSDDLDFFTGPPPMPEDPDELVWDMVHAVRRARGLTRRVSVFDPVGIPPEFGSLDVLDVLVISTKRIASDPGGIAAIRDWVLGGGNLWILLEEAGPETATAILGDSFDTTIVDRVRLTSLKFENARPRRHHESDEVLFFEEPVEFVRVVPGSVTVTERVDGWPAAFWQPLGAGKVYFTALSPLAWMRPTTPNDPPPVIKGEDTPYFPREPLTEFAYECMQMQPTPDLDEATMRPFLTEQIGYQILSRRGVATILGIFCLVLLLAGVWCFRIGRPERILWYAPLAAILTSIVFVGIAAVTKRSVPPTVAVIARLTLESRVETGHVSGLAAIYNPNASNETLGATNGGIFFPDMTAMGGRNRRVVWTDEGTWNWDALELPPGVRTAPLSWQLPLEESVDCTARFGPNGLQGAVGPIPLEGRLEDAILALPHQPVMEVDVGEDGLLTAGTDQVLAPGVFMSEALLSDQQRRRSNILAKVFETRQKSDLPPRPVLFAWSSLCDLGFVFPQDRQLGSTLLSIPMRIERSEPGALVTVPAPFISCRAVTDPEGNQPEAYSNITHQWVESKRSVTDWLTFQLPSSVLPIQLSRVTGSITVRAPSRTVELLAPVDGDLISVAQFSRPFGSYSFVLDRSDQLTLNEDGGLMLAVRVSEGTAGDSDDLMAQATWKIDSLQLQAVGTVQGD